MGEQALGRRAFLGALGALAFGGSLVRGGEGRRGLGVAEAFAVASKESRSSKLRSVQVGPLGATFELWLDAAPFPAEDAPYSDATVIVFVPAGFRAPRSGVVDAWVHFHGHSSMASSTVVAHALREQLVESGRNAILLAPQGPVRAADGNPGKLSRSHGLARLLSEALGVLGTKAARKALGPSAIASATRCGKVIVSSHSGGYRAAAACARAQGVDLRELYLFDSLYGEAPVFGTWVGGGRAGRRRKLVTHFVSAEVKARSSELAELLGKKGIPCTHTVDHGGGPMLPLAQLRRARALFVEGHAPHDAVVHASRPLRTYLRASCLQGRG